MQGLMQQSALTVDTILDHAKRWHGEREVVSRSVEGPIVRTTYAQLHERARRLSNALLGLDIKHGDRVATLAWNTGRHMEAWYGIMGIGAVCHTLNPRLHPDQIAWIIRHAEDRIIFVDLTFVPIIEQILADCPSVEHVVIMTDHHHMPPFQIRGVPTLKWQGSHTYESLIDGSSPDVAWGGFDENTACGLCYTSGTTGDPKGVLYSHRSNYIHTLVGLQRDVLGLSALDTVLPVVPMFHANAWGTAFACPGVGAKLVMPGPKMDGASIHELLETEGVTFSAAVPTVWQMLLQHLDETKGKLTTLTKVVIGGAACPESIIRGFHDRYGVDVLHAWGMTETSPLGTLGAPNARVAGLSYDERMAYKLKQGRPPLGIDLKLTDDEGRELPHDAKTFGHLKVKGPFVVREYFKGAGGRILDGDGFFDTGDVATIDSEGFMQITDRAKDVIKSGGEWISTIDIENIAVGHPKVDLAAVIGLPHPKWDERPLLVIKLKSGEKASKEEILRFLEGKIAKWWMPDDVAFVDDIPLGATGKIDKKLIRQRLKDYVLPATPVLVAATVAERAAPDPVLHAPEDSPGKSEAPASVALAGAEDSPTAESENPAPVEAEAVKTDAAPSEPAVDKPEPAVVEPAAEGEAAPVKADAPTLSDAPAMTPVKDDEAAGDRPLSLHGETVKTAAAPEKADKVEAPLVMSPPVGLKPKTKARKKKKAGGGLADGYLNLAILVALAPAVMVAVGALGIRLGLLTEEQGYFAMLQHGPTPFLGWAPAIALVSVVTGLIGLLVAIFGGAGRLWGRAILALVVTALTWGLFFGAQLKAEAAPPITEAATDWREPVMFSDALIRTRGRKANPVDPSPILPVGSRAYAGRSIAEVNAETCPGARSVVLSAPTEAAFEAARTALSRAGLKLVTADAAAGRLEATAETFWYGFKDDVAVRIRPEGAGARIDLRSSSRMNRLDLGANCDRITTLVAAIRG
ncbi:MAG: long-chain-fatty-acid--CoA ligase [Caulobacter sp.]|nr:long-chain-fatty-acid--CoA ligase [Caulobacter sp.]